MIGQVRLLDIIDKHIRENRFPRTLLLEGEYGCGKHTVANIISNKLMLDLIDISDNLKLETIEQITLSATPHLYIINCQDISIKEQNIILKFLEEPLKNSYIVLLCENKNLLLNTVINRCVVWSFEQYTDEELAQVAGNQTSIAFKYANTPGRIVEFAEHPVDDMHSYATKILTQVGIANYSNILTIPRKINFKDDVDLFDFNVFTYILLHTAVDLYKEKAIPYNAFTRTRQFYNDCKIPHINKVHLFEHYLIELKQLFRGGL